MEYHVSQNKNVIFNLKILSAVLDCLTEIYLSLSFSGYGKPYPSTVLYCREGNNFKYNLIKYFPEEFWPFFHSSPSISCKPSYLILRCSNSREMPSHFVDSSSNFIPP